MADLKQEFILVLEMGYTLMGSIFRWALMTIGVYCFLETLMAGLKILLTGAVIQYGGSVYFGGLTVSDVAYGIVGVNAGSMRVTSPISLTASNTALYLSGGQWTGGGVALIATTGNALILDNAAHAAVKTGEVKGAIKVSSGSIGKINYEGQGGFDADVQILDSNLTLITAAGSNPAYDISRFTCNGMSFLNIDTINVRNNGGNHCLDDTGWNAVIDATFP